MKTLLGAAALMAFGSAAAVGAESPRFDPQRIKADIAFLADDLLEGRFTGSRGYDIAAAFTASRFAALNLQPGNGNSWYQQVPFAEASRKAGAPSLMRVDGATFRNGVDIAMYPNSAFLDQVIEGDAVFVGYGLDAPGLGMNDYEGLDVRGKVAVALWGFPKGAPSEVAAHYLNEKQRMAKEHGAIALLSIHTPVLEKIVPWDRLRTRADDADVKWIGSDGKPRYPGPDLAANGWISPKAAAALFKGSPVALDTLLQAPLQDGVKPRGFALKPKVRIERHSTARRMQSPNVLAILPGSDPALANEFIVLSAHLDHIGSVRAENGDSIANGAMDNASGVALLLEVARAFVESGQRPRRSILFAALTGEEVGLLGAEYLAKHPTVGGGKVVGVVNLDMPVLTFDFQDVVAFGAEHSTIAEAAARAAGSVGVKLSPDPAPEQVSFVRTDHYPFVKEGIPAISFDTGPAGAGAKAIEDFLTNHYHRASDDMSRPFNWAAAAKFARINYLLARDLADAPQPPLWYRGDFFGESFAKDAPKASR